jgi:hypothetical protein
MALKRTRPTGDKTPGHVSHDALVRIDARVKDILVRREAALRRARRAAQRLKQR